MQLSKHECRSSTAWAACAGGFLLSYTCPASTPGKRGESITKVSGEITVPH